MIPTAVIFAIPPLFLTSVFLLALYHILPLIHILPRPGPFLARIATLVPRPKLALPGKRNLPREFFNLPPRPDSPHGSRKYSREGSVERSGEDGFEEQTTAGAALGVRGKIVLLLSTQVTVSLICGWVFIAVPLEVGSYVGNALLGVTVFTLPCTIATMALYTAMGRPAYIARYKLSTFRLGLFGSGGVTHETIVSRIAPISSLLMVVCSIAAIAAGSVGGVVILTTASSIVGGTIILAVTSFYKRKTHEETGRIRLASSSPSPSPSPEREMEASSSIGYSGRRIMLSDEELRAFKDSDSWVESPSRPPTPASPFSYSPSLHNRPSAMTLVSSVTPKTQSSFYTTPRSELTEATHTPTTISSWDFSSSPPPLPAPSTALTRQNSRSASRSLGDATSPPMSHLPVAYTFNRNMPRGSGTTTYTQTLTSTPGSALRGAGGSILGTYSPDPFQRMPQGFESLSSFPVPASHDGVASRASLIGRSGTGMSGAVPLTSTSTLTFVPERPESAADRLTSSYTLHSYHMSSGHGHGHEHEHDTDRPNTALSLAYTTPKNQIRHSRQSHRAPPPPPMPDGLPLPPTPTAARSDTMWGRSDRGRSESPMDGGSGNYKNSTDLLLADLDADWVDVANEGEELEDWGRGGRGVGVLALLCVAACTALSAPVLSNGLTDTSTILFLIAFLLPVPCIIFASYLLRPRPLPYPTQPHNLKKGSTTSLTTHRSLALASASESSLPMDMSPKLTPALRKQPSASLAERWGKLINNKPSIRQFGYQPRTRTLTKQHPSQSRMSVRHELDLRRHTILGVANAAAAASAVQLQQLDAQAEAAMKRNMHRRSADLWLEAGHARPASTRFERAREMIKPSPALCMLDNIQESPSSASATQLGLVQGDTVLHRLRGGVVSMLPKRVSQVFGVYGPGPGQGDIELGQFQDADNSMAAIEVNTGAMARPHSPITIHVTSPSKFERRESGLSFAPSSVTGSPSKSTEGGHGAGSGRLADEYMGEIQFATRGRMSAGPMYLFNAGGVSPTSLTFSPVRSRFETRPVSGQFADAESPRKRLDSNISISSNPRRRSASVYGALEQVSSTLRYADKATLQERRELRHKHSFSLPLTDKVSFSDLRGRLDKCGKRPGHISIYADTEVDPDATPKMRPKSAWPLVHPDQSFEDAIGADLPAFPVDFTQPHLSPSSIAHAQMQTPARRQLNGQMEPGVTPITGTTRSLAKFSLRASAYLENHPSPLSTNTFSGTQQRERLSTESSVVGHANESLVSLVSENEALAREMEDVLRMDSPTRAEFVISPQPSMTSMAGSNRSSWARDRAVSRASSTGSLLNRAASFGRAQSPWGFGVGGADAAHASATASGSGNARYAPAPALAPADVEQGSQIQKKGSAASFASARTTDSRTSTWTSASGSTYAPSTEGDYSIIGTWEVAPPVPVLPINLRRPQSQVMAGPSTAGTTMGHVDVESDINANGKAVSKRTSVNFSHPFPAAPVAQNRGLGLNTSIPLPPPSALAALAPGARPVMTPALVINKRNSAQLPSRLMPVHPSIASLDKKSEGTERPKTESIAAASDGPLGDTEEAGRRHASTKSIDTLHSAISVDMESDAESGGAGSVRQSHTPEWRMSEQEIKRVQLLRERVARGEEITRMSVIAPAADAESEAEMEEMDSECFGSSVADSDEGSYRDTFTDDARDEYADEFGDHLDGDLDALADAALDPTELASPTTGRVQTVVRTIEARSKGSIPPSPEKLSATPKAKLSTEPKATMSTDSIVSEKPPQPHQQQQQQQQRKGLKPLRLLANRPPSVLGPSRLANEALSESHPGRIETAVTESKVKSKNNGKGKGKGKGSGKGVASSPKKRAPLSTTPSNGSANTPHRIPKLSMPSTISGSGSGSGAFIGGSGKMYVFSEGIGGAGKPGNGHGHGQKSKKGSLASTASGWASKENLPLGTLVSGSTTSLGHVSESPGKKRSKKSSLGAGAIRA